jgi:MFS family permease
MSVAFRFRAVMAYGRSVTAPQGVAAPEPPRPSLRAVLRTPDLLSTLVLSVLARIPASAIGLLILLRVAPEHGYASAGIIEAVYAVAVGVGQPLTSRAVDRYGQTAILLPSTLISGLAVVAVGLLPDDASLLRLGVLFLVAGAVHPPLAGAMRALWDLLLPTEEERHVGYALDASANEVVWLVGPIALVGILAAATSVSIGLIVCGALTAGAGGAFALTGPSQRWRPRSTEHTGGMFGGLRNGGVWTIMLAAASAGAVFGAVQLGVTAFGREQGGTAAVGLLLGAWSVGSFLAGLALTRLAPPELPAARLETLLLFLAVSTAVCGLAPNVWVLGVLLVLSGAAIAPLFATLDVAMGDVASDGTITETYALTTTGVIIGGMLGGPFAGFLADHASASTAIVAAGIPPLLGATLVFLRRTTLRPRAA